MTTILRCLEKFKKYMFCVLHCQSFLSKTVDWKQMQIFLITQTVKSVSLLQSMLIANEELKLNMNMLTI